MKLAVWDAVPGEPVPVTVTRYEPGVEELKAQDPVPVPLTVNVTAVAWQATVRPAVGLTTEERLTLPAKLKRPVSETELDAPGAPVLKLTGLPTEIVKSPT